MISSETTAGLAVTEIYKPNVPQHLYPTLDTRPCTSVERDLEGLEDDPDFWNMTIDEDDEIKNEEIEDIPIMDLTAPRDVKLGGSSLATQPANTPKKMANGKYLCNHPCKDKTKCRHFWFVCNPCIVYWLTVF
ncbi:hypothetical protein QCA50_003623 [Cerrena zonata]|uniref:Uncharacterized protein n=1 Tax=Cerrena zonata TaxID=2478898 RepID=A0AAW0GVD3_9APHY